MLKCKQSAVNIKTLKAYYVQAHLSWKQYYKVFNEIQNDSYDTTVKLIVFIF